MNLWDDVLAKVESKVNRHSFNTWFRPTRLLFEAQNTVGVLVPNAHFRDWLNKHYSGVIHESLGELHRPDLEVVFETDLAGDHPSFSRPTSEASGPPPSIKAPQPVGGTSADDPRSAPLNPKYRFESYVVGTSNQFANAAARAVAPPPSDIDAAIWDELDQAERDYFARAELLGQVTYGRSIASSAETPASRGTQLDLRG